MNNIWGFDLGKASIGICVRQKDEVKFLNSYLFDVEYADTNKWKQARKAAFRTRISRRKRQDWLEKVWAKLNWPIPDTKAISYLTGLKARLEIIENNIQSTNQLFYALYDLIQSRGYDSKVPWGSKIKGKTEEKESDDEKENKRKLEQYQEQLTEFGLTENSFPCQLEYCKISKRQKVKGAVYPREEIIKETEQILENASDKFSELKGKTNYILWGNEQKPYNGLTKEDKKAYSSKHQGEGILGQKLPKFDNRIIGKCRLFGRLNACKADKEIIIKTKLIQTLKNLRYSIDTLKYNLKLNSSEINKIAEKCLEKIKDKEAKEITFKQFYEILYSEKVFNLPPYPKKAGTERRKHFNLFVQDDKLQIKTSGRASFSQLAAELYCEVVLSGLAPTEYLENNINEKTWREKFKITNNVKTGLTEEEIAKAIIKLGDSWENISIRDDREEIKELNSIKEKQKLIEKLIGSVTSYVVKNRLQHFYNIIKYLDQKFGQPDKVVLEFVREADSSFLPKKKKDDWDKQIKNNQKANEQAQKDLKREGIAITYKNIMAYKLLQQQNEQCLYSGERMTISDIKENNFEIDHIMPRSRSHCDSIFNLALVLPTENQAKSNQTPHQYLSKNNKWAEFVERIKTNSKIQGKKKDLLLDRLRNKKI